MTEQLEINPEKISRLDRVVSIILLAGAAIVPVSVSLRGSAVFRLLPELAMIVIATVASTIFVTGRLITTAPFSPIQPKARTAALLAMTAFAWTIVAALFSSHRAVSFDSFPFVFSVIAVALLAALVFKHVTPAVAACVIALPAVINLVVLSLQASRLWNPWVFERQFSRMHKNALLGNPNDVGAYFVGPAILMAVMAVSAVRGRVFYAIAAAAFIGAIVLSVTLTAIASVSIALAILLILRYRRRGVIAIALLGITFVLAASLYAPLTNRIVRMTAEAERPQLDELISFRLPAMTAAWEMFKDDPITGLGPGIYKFEFTRYRIGTIEPYGRRFASAAPRLVNHFNEPHNDHLQILAETGIPGYLLLLGAFTLVGSISFRTLEPRSERERMARLLALPLCVGLAVTMITGFPLQLAAPAYTFVLLAGTCIAWSAVDDVA